ncbi:MAG: DUF4443 domain-containing protein [archaeon]
MLGKLAELVDKRASYSVVHIVRALLLLSETPAGRFSFMSKLRIGEASAKTLLNSLCDAGIAKPSVKGAVLTQKGEALVRSLLTQISEPRSIAATDFAVAKQNIAIIVRNSAKRVGNCISLRDTAVKAGAAGLTVLVKEGGRLRLPNCSFSLEPIEGVVKSLFKVENGDAVLIGSSPDAITAEEGAIAAALQLVAP